MSVAFEEIDRQSTAMGEISLRRRLEPSLHIDVYEVKLDDEFLMSSLFTVAEVALAHLGLAATTGDALDVVVGGLGLGYTARTVLGDPRVRSLYVVEALGEVISWHQRALLPLADEMTSDPRCHLVEADFFARVAGRARFDSGEPPQFHAILVDIDHTPRHVLHPSHAAFYTRAGLHSLAERLHPGGVFGLWSDDPPDAELIAVCNDVFGDCVAHVVTFPNFYTGAESSSTVYIAPNRT